MSVVAPMNPDQVIPTQADPHSHTAMAAPAPASRPIPSFNFTINEMENGYKATSDDVKERFQWLADTVAGFSGHEQRFFTVVENPDKVIQMGCWDSLEDHYIAYNTTPALEDIADEFGGILDIRSNWHTTISHDAPAWDASLITFVRFYVPHNEKAGFDRTMPKFLTSVQAKCGSKVSGGWRLSFAFYDHEDQDDLPTYAPDMVDKYDLDPEECEEWDCLIPWPSMDASKGEFEVDGFADMMKHVSKIQVKHCERLALDVPTA